MSEKETLKKIDVDLIIGKFTEAVVANTEKSIELNLLCLNKSQ